MRDEYLTTQQLAEMLGGLRPQTLRSWRVRGCGPPYIRIGRGTRAKVLYRLSVVHAWLDERTYRNTSEEHVKGERP